MDPITAASAFASVVGLLGQFKSSKDSVQGKDFNEFMIWLVETGHNELKSLIEASHTTMIGVKAVLHLQNDALAVSLARLDLALATFASTIEGFAEISQGVKPNALLSGQALSILKQLEIAGAASAHEVNALSGYRLLIGNTYWLPTDLQFITDDLNILVELRLLRLETTAKGGRTFHYTRMARELLNSHSSQVDDN